MSDEWLTLRTFDTPALAELAKLHLAEAGIECRLQNTEIVGMNPLLGNAVGYIPLLVQENDLEAAAEVLTKIAPSAAGNCENCGEPLAVEGPCPLCGHSTDPAEHGADESAADEETSLEESVFLDGLRSWRRPVILLFLAPALVSLALAAAAAVNMLLNLVWR